MGAGLVEVIFAIGLIAGSSLLGILGDRFNKIKTIIIGMFIMGLSLGFSGLLSPSMFCLFVVMSFSIGLSAPFYAYIQSEIAPHILGRVFSFLSSLALLTTLIGLGIAGIFTELTSVATLITLTGILITIVGSVTVKFK